MLHPDIRNRKPVGRRSLRFIDEENVLAVGDQLATKVRPYAARAAFDVYSLIQPSPLLGCWSDRSCECLSHLESPSFWGTTDPTSDDAGTKPSAYCFRLPRCGPRARL